MKANNIIKTFFNCSVLESLSRAHSSKKELQRVNLLVEKILDQIMREWRMRVGAKQACKGLQNFW